MVSTAGWLFLSDNLTALFRHLLLDYQLVLMQSLLDLLVRHLSVLHFKFKLVLEGVGLLS